MARTKTTWDSGSSWRHGKTKVVRIPVVLEDEVMYYARQIDAHNNDSLAIEEREGDIFLILGVIEKYIEYREKHRHVNQHSKTKTLDINARTWDELRKLQKLLMENPLVLGIAPGAD